MLHYDITVDAIIALITVHNSAKTHNAPSNNSTQFVSTPAVLASMSTRANNSCRRLT